ncbi:g11765 [Coccomyxa viridis]|uniref:G11765 protein n=1 Tax=Coccomyxa viridis TaxID=1274662 RepID=A0ABP1G8T9_9CHLO
MTRLLLDTFPDGQSGMNALLGAPPADAAALAPGPAALAPLSQHLQQLLAPARAPSPLPADFNFTVPPGVASGPAVVPTNSPAVHTIFIASWVSILAAVGIIFLICAVIMASKVFRGPTQGLFGITIPGRRSGTVEGAVTPTTPADAAKPAPKGSPQLHRVILELPNNDICCGVELTPEDREGPKSSA